MNSTRFKYLTGKNGSEPGILDSIDKKDYSKIMIVRDEDHCNYMMIVRSKLDELYNYMIRSKKPIALHEVILGECSQRFRMDIDVSTSSPEFAALEVPNHFSSLRNYTPQICSTCGYAISQSLTCDECNTIQQSVSQQQHIADIKASYILYRIIEAYTNVVGSELARVRIDKKNLDYVLCESNGPGKYSYHLISNVWCSRADQVNLLANKVHDAIVPEIKIFNDVAVCAKSTHNLRLCLSTKQGTTRIKKLYNKPNPKSITKEEWLSTLVTNIEYEYIYLDFDLFNPPSVGSLSELQMELKRNSNKLIPYEMENLPNDILIRAQQYFKGLEPSTRKDNLYSFRRLEPGYCEICKRVHDHNDSLYITAYTTKFIARCHRGSGVLYL